MSTNNSIVIYTAVFGKKDRLIDPKIAPEGVDFVCFTDQDFTSRVWKVRKVVPPVEGDATRSARRYKILAHEYLPEYEYSIWVDGNILVKQDVRELIKKKLSQHNMAVYNHAFSKEFPLHSLFEGADFLIETAHKGKWQEDPILVERQREAYIKEGYPNNNGLLWSCVMLRRHNQEDVIKAMNIWWNEIVTRTKRDQMSFNYAAWKTGLNFLYIEEDAAENEYFRRLSHYLNPKQKLHSYMLGALKRIRRIISLK